MGVYSTIIVPGVIVPVATFKSTVIGEIEKAKIRINTPIEISKLKNKAKKTEDEAEKAHILGSIDEVKESAENKIKEIAKSIKSTKASLKETLERYAEEADIYQSEVISHITSLSGKEAALTIKLPIMVSAVFSNPYTLTAGPSTLETYREEIMGAIQEAETLKKSFSQLKEKVNAINSILCNFSSPSELTELVESEFSELDKIEESATKAIDKLKETMGGVSSVSLGTAGEEIASAGIEAAEYVIEENTNLDNVLSQLESLSQKKEEFLGTISSLPDLNDYVSLPLKKDIEYQEKAVSAAVAFTEILQNIFNKTESAADTVQATTYESDYNKYCKKIKNGETLTDEESVRLKSAISWGKENGHETWKYPEL